MSKLVVKNSHLNSLMVYLKNKRLSFTITKLDPNIEKITFSPRTATQKFELMSELNSYGTNLYHDCVLELNSKVINKQNYVSHQYESMILNNTELELPNHYIDNENEQNEKYEDFKALNSKFASRDYMYNILEKQQFLLPRNSEQLDKFRNIYFGTEAESNRSKQYSNDFPYYNIIECASVGNNSYLKNTLETVDSKEELFDSMINPPSALRTDFIVNEEEIELVTYDVNEIIGTSVFSFNEDNKLVINNNKARSNHMIDNFKKFMLTSILESNPRQFVKSFTEIYSKEACEKEYIIYKIDKFKDTDTLPIQTFWMYGDEMKEYIDYQVKLNQVYRYKITSYVIIYGTSTSLENVIEGRGNTVSANFITNPSFRMAIIDFNEITLKTSQKAHVPPFVSFQNESNSNNFIKIYLDLKNSSKKENFIQITSLDATTVQDLQTDEEGKIDFEYSKEDGKFEVFRLSEKPNDYTSFANAKILDVRNKIPSTSVVFKDSVVPNKKYYYMFRAVNYTGVPSNPTPVYEVELIKDASKSKINIKKFKMDINNIYHDKNFKNLLQIRPAFQQDVINDQSEFIQNLPTFKKRINDIELGVAEDAIWGKKFKIRIKSKDTGKIIDLNVKFNLTKDNIK